MWVSSWTSNQSWVFSVVCQPISKYVVFFYAPHTFWDLLEVFLRHIIISLWFYRYCLPHQMLIKCFASILSCYQYTGVSLPEGSLRSCSLWSGKWPNKSCILVYCCWTRVYIMNLEPKWPLHLKVNPPKQGPFQSKQRSFGLQEHSCEFQNALNIDSHSKCNIILYVCMK